MFIARVLKNGHSDFRTVLMEISNKWDTNMNVCPVPATSSSVIAVKLSVLTYFNMIVKC